MPDATASRTGNNPLGALRRFAQQAPAGRQERCDLCGEAIGVAHRHLLNVAERQVLCACRACTVLFDAPAAGGGSRRLIPTRVRKLADFVMTDSQWDALQIPVKMAFFCHSSVAQKVTAFYPSPMGPTESTLPLTAWEELVEQNGVLQEMAPDVLALLIRRDSEHRDVFLAPIDACYRLVGSIRMAWSGIAGGSEVQKQIDLFFAELEKRADADARS